MKTRNRFLAAILGIAILSTLGAVFATPLLPAGALAAHATGIGMTRHHGGGRGHCGHLDEKSTALLGAYLGISLELTDAQQATLTPVLQVLDGWRVAVRASCDHADFADAPDALRTLNRLVERTRTSMIELLPAFDTIYGT